MRKKKWQRAAIDAKLEELRLKYRDPETRRAYEGVGTEFHREWKEWCEAQDWLIDLDEVATRTRRDNIERLALPKDDEGFPEFQAQCILPLDLDDCLTIVAADARQPDLQEHAAMRQQQLDAQLSAGSRYILGIRRHASEFQTMNERWIEVQKRRGK